MFRKEKKNDLNNNSYEPVSYNPEGYNYNSFSSNYDNYSTYNSCSEFSDKPWESNSSDLYFNENKKKNFKAGIDKFNSIKNLKSKNINHSDIGRRAKTIRQIFKTNIFATLALIFIISSTGEDEEYFNDVVIEYGTYEEVKDSIKDISYVVGQRDTKTSNLLEKRYSHYKTFNNGNHLYLNWDYSSSDNIMYTVLNSKMNKIFSYEDEVPKNMEFSKCINIKDDLILIEYTPTNDNDSYNNVYKLINGKGESIEEKNVIFKNDTALYYDYELNHYILVQKEDFRPYIKRYDENNNNIYSEKIDIVGDISDVFFNNGNTYVVADYYGGLNSIIKLDDNGEYVYETIIDWKDCDFYNYLVTSDDGVLIQGEGYHIENQYELSSFIMKIDVFGGVEWFYEYNAKSDNQIITEAYDGYILVNTERYLAKTENDIPYDITSVLKLDFNGNMIDYSYIGTFNDSKKEYSFDIEKVYKEGNDIIIYACSNDLYNKVVDMKFAINEDLEINEIYN